MKEVKRGSPTTSDSLKVIYRIQGEVPVNKVADFISSTKEMVKSKETGGLISKTTISFVDEENSLLGVEFYLELFDLESNGIPQLISTITTNFFELVKIGEIELVDMQIPKDLLTYFPGPKLGSEGIKRMLASKGPLLGVVMRTNPEILPATQARIFYDIAISGIDVGADPQYLSNQSFSPIEARTSHFADMIDRVRGETGRRIMYAINITAGCDKIMEFAEKAVENGATALEIDISCTGLSTLEMLNKEGDFGVPIYVTGINEASFITSRGSISGKAMALMVRLLGGDLIARVAISRESYHLEELKGIDEAMRRKLDKLSPAMPAACRGVFPGSLEANILTFGQDQVLMADEAIFFHPWGIQAGAKALREAMDAIMRGEGVLMAAQTHDELKQAIEKWGYGPT